jgi:hypothetical protein
MAKSMFDAKSMAHTVAPGGVDRTAYSPNQWHASAYDLSQMLSNLWRSSSACPIGLSYPLSTLDNWTLHRASSFSD